MFQTRSEQNGLSLHPTLEAALIAADVDPSIWKISFPAANGERVRLTRSESNQFVCDPLMDAIKAELQKEGLLCLDP